MMSLTFSEKIYKCLIGKVLKFNEKHESKIVLDQLIKIYKRGEKAADVNWQPRRTTAQWAMARVNMFLRLASDQKVEKSYEPHDIDVIQGTDRTHKQEEADPFWNFSNLDLTSAHTDLLLVSIADSEAEKYFSPPVLEED